MSTILGDLIPDKSTRDVNQAANLVKEGLQELILCTLSRQGFFDLPYSIETWILISGRTLRIWSKNWGARASLSLQTSVDHVESSRFTLQNSRSTYAKLWNLPDSMQI